MRAHRWILAKLVVLLLALGSWPSAAWAWGEEGHEIVATAARDILFARDPSFQQRFYAILQPDILDFSYTYVDRGQTRHRSCSADRMREASVWADCVRNSAQYRSTRPYHYDDVRYCTDTVAQRAYRALTPAPQCDAGSTEASGTMTYVDNFRTPTQEQLASAAIRLADLLERVLP